MLGKDNINTVELLQVYSSSKTKQVSRISENLFPSPKILLPLSSHDSWIWHQQLHCYQHGPPFALLVEGLGLQKHCQPQEALPPSDRFVVPEIREISPPAVFMEAIRLREASKGIEVEMIKLCYFVGFFWEGREKKPWCMPMFYPRDDVGKKRSKEYPGPSQLFPKYSPQGFTRGCWRETIAKHEAAAMSKSFSICSSSALTENGIENSFFSNSHKQKNSLIIPATCTLESWAFSSNNPGSLLKLPQLKSLLPRTEMTGWNDVTSWSPESVTHPTSKSCLKGNGMQWKISLVLNKTCSKLYRIKKMSTWFNPLLSLVSFGRLPVEPLGSFLRFLGAHGSARGFSKEVAKVALIYIHIHIYIYTYVYTDIDTWWYIIHLWWVLIFTVRQHHSTSRSFNIQHNVA